MENGRDGFRKLLEVQVEGLQDQLYALEREPDQVEHLKSILRICQRLRQGRDPDEPESVRMLRNAVEKVTLHLGREQLAVSQEVLDFYVDTFDLLEEAVRRWPGGPAFDRARYADRVRGLLEATAPPSTWPAAEPTGAEPSEIGVALGVATPGVEFGGTVREADAPAGTATPHPGETRAGAELGNDAQPALQDVRTWSEREEGRRLELVPASELTFEERKQFVEVDLRELLAEPWRGVREEGGAEAAGVQGAAEMAGTARAGDAPGGLAASYTTFEALRAEALEGPPSAPSAVLGATADARPALGRLRETLEAASAAVEDLGRAADEVAEQSLGGHDRAELSALSDRLEQEQRRLVSIFDRAVGRLNEPFDAGAV